VPRVELCGPPGVGKSTILAAYGPRQSRPTPIEDRSSDHPFLKFIRRAYQRASRSRRVGYDQTKEAFWHALAADRALGHRVYDELLAQRGLSLALARPEDFDVVRGYFEVMPAPALIVFVGAPLRVLQERNRRRALGNSKKCDRSGQAAYLIEAMNVARYRLITRGVDTMNLDATLPAEENARLLRERLEA
jgi:hypothetical protein